MCREFGVPPWTSTGRPAGSPPDSTHRTRPSGAATVVAVVSTTEKVPGTVPLRRGSWSNGEHVWGRRTGAVAWHIEPGGIAGHRILTSRRFSARRSLVGPSLAGRGLGATDRGWVGRPTRRPGSRGDVLQRPARHGGRLHPGPGRVAARRGPAGSAGPPARLLRGQTRRPRPGSRGSTAEVGGAASSRMVRPARRPTTGAAGRPSPAPPDTTARRSTTQHDEPGRKSPW